MPSGRLMKDNEHEESESGEESTETKKNGNGNGSNGNGGAVSEGWSQKYKKSIDCKNPKGFSQRAHCQGRKKVEEAKNYEKDDHEVSMAKKQVEKSADNLKKLAKVLSKKTDKDNLPAWVQAKITNAEHDTEAASSYMEQACPICNEDPCQCLEGTVTEGNRDGKSAKDKDYSLRDWFKGDGWVQVSGKYKGKPCAKQKGQKSKPFCRDADDAAAMSPEEKKRRTTRKRRQDPNPDRKGKAKIVTKDKNKTESYSNWREELSEEGVDTLKDKRQGSEPPKQKPEYKNPYGLKGIGPGVRDLKAHFESEGEVVSEKKDACYHKVKSRYKIWPSAYASGALVKCRKVGAKNWGNKTKKEGYEFSNWRDDFQPIEIETVDLITADPIQVPPSNLQKIEEAKKCWKGYKKVGTQKLFGKTYNRCEKIKKEEFSDWRQELEEDWQKVNRKDKTDGMSQKAVNAYKRENPGSKLKTAVTEKNPTGKRAERRKNFCSRSNGQRKMHNIDCSKTPEKKICKARKRWRC